MLLRLLLLMMMTMMMKMTGAADLCLSDNDCSAWQGRTCVRLYDGCLVGQCMCQSRHHSTLDSTGRCVGGKTRHSSHYLALFHVALQSTKLLPVGEQEKL